jgi:hypothetical protein
MQINSLLDGRIDAQGHTAPVRPSCGKGFDIYMCGQGGQGF